MIKLVASLLSSLKATVEKTSNIVCAASYRSKTILNQVTYFGRTKVEYSTGEFVEISKSLTETVAISSTGVIVVQDYGDNYFLQDYVGTSRTIT